MFEPSESCGATDLRRDNSQVRALYRNGLLVKAPTGQTSIMLPDSSDSIERPTKLMISECSPRPPMPSSITPAIS